MLHKSIALACPIRRIVMIPSTQPIFMTFIVHVCRFILSFLLMFPFQVLIDIMVSLTWEIGQKIRLDWSKIDQDGGNKEVRPGMKNLLAQIFICVLH